MSKKSRQSKIIEIISTSEASSFGATPLASRV